LFAFWSPFLAPAAYLSFDELHDISAAILGTTAFEMRWRRAVAAQPARFERRGPDAEQRGYLSARQDVVGRFVAVAIVRLMTRAAAS